MSSKVFRPVGILTGRWCHTVWIPSSGALPNNMRHISSTATSDESDNHFDRKQKYLGHVAVALVATCALGGTFLWKLRKNKVRAAEKVEAGSIRPGLPTYTLEEVSRHKTKEAGIWITYKNGVYDITDYVSKHPGGSKILLAAGGAVEPFWNLYGVHKHPDILSIAENYRIGNILEVPKEEVTSKEDPYANDPPRNPVLIPSSKKPFNGEPPAVLLVDNYLTPNDLFFIRNHLPVPNVDPRTFTLEVQGPKREWKYSLNDLKTRFKKKSVVSVVQCAGNRRSEMINIKPVKGLNWGSAAIGNAEWSGVPLVSLLTQAGIDLEKTDKLHLVFEGLDTGPDGSRYGASIPIELARLLKDEIIIAYEMNGKELPRDHGFPLRVIIPGVVGARQVKWLNKIYLSNDESECHWQRRDYKGFNSSVDWHNVDFDSSVAIMQLPVISAICDPPAGTELEEGAEDVTVRGYAWSGGGKAVIRVDVSADGGKTWHVAFLQPNSQSQYRAWGWSLWEATVPLPKDHNEEVELVCKAVDVSYNVQPDSVEGIWNLRGVLSNPWHRIKVTVPPSS